MQPRAGRRRPLGEVVARPRAGAVRVARRARAARATPSRRSTSRMPRRSPRRSAGAGEVAVDRAEPERVDARRRRPRSRCRARRRAAGARARPLPASATHARAEAPAPALTARVVGALGERVHPRVERRERGLVVVGRRAARSGSCDDPARHRARGEALERRHRRVQVGVVAVDRVDVVAQPDAGVGDLRRAPGAARSASARGERPGVAPARSRCSSPRKPGGSVCRRPSIQPATSPWSWLPASTSSSPSRPERARRRRRRTAPASSAASRCGASRSSSPSPRITSRSTPSQRLEQRRAQLGAAQQVGAACSRRGAGRRSTSVRTAL